MLKVQDNMIEVTQAVHKDDSGGVLNTKLRGVRGMLPPASCNW